MKRSKGFTLIELLVVMAIIGILALVTLSNVMVAPVRARDAKRKHDLQQIRTALQLYYTDHGSYPPHTQWCTSLQACWSSLLPSTYIAKMPVDPKNTNDGYVYWYASECSDSDYILVSVPENQDISDHDIKKTGETVTTKCGTTYAPGANAFVFLAP